MAETYMKKHITVVEGDPLLRERWKRTLGRLRPAGYEAEVLEAVPDVPGALFRRFILGHESYLVLGAPGRPGVECTRLYDAACALGYDSLVCVASDKGTTRYDVGYPPAPMTEEFSRHSLLLAAFVVGKKYVAAPGAARPVRFDILPAAERKPGFDPDIAAAYARLTSSL